MPTRQTLHLPHHPPPPPRAVRSTPLATPSEPPPGICERCLAAWHQGRADARTAGVHVRRAATCPHWGDGTLLNIAFITRSAGVLGWDSEFGVKPSEWNARYAALCNEHSGYTAGDLLKGWAKITSKAGER